MQGKLISTGRSAGRPRHTERDPNQRSVKYYKGLWADATMEAGLLGISTAEFINLSVQGCVDMARQEGPFNQVRVPDFIIRLRQYKEAVPPVISKLTIGPRQTRKKGRAK